MIPRTLVVKFYKGLVSLIAQHKDKVRLVFRLIFLLRNGTVCLFRCDIPPAEGKNCVALVYNLWNRSCIWGDMIFPAQIRENERVF
jgi:hypothetical protein